LIFVKLGGSLITNKNQAYSARRPLISRLVQEIKQALQANPELSIILGHGSGSFGHPPAKKFQTRLGVRTENEWHGFIEVRQQADALHRIVMDELWQAGLNAISFPPSSLVVTRNHMDIQMNIQPLRHALQHTLLPVVFGDVVFDHTLGGTIVSTEEILAHLCDHLPIQRIYIAGIEKGVWKNSNDPQQLFQVLTPAEFSTFAEEIKGSSAPDVTGGMRSKVEILFSIIQKHPNMEATIFSGEEPDNLFQVLTGKPCGTMLKNA
ncbi:MAG: hypothetical protein XD73_0975, partial [Anaerolinea thermophila]